MESEQSKDGVANVLFKHFGIYEAKELLLRPLTLDIKKLTVECGNTSAPFKSTLYTHIQAISAVDDTVLLWLGCRLPMHFREQEFGFHADLSCEKIFYDIHGLRPVFEGLDATRKLRIHHHVQVSVEIDLTTQVNPR